MSDNDQPTRLDAAMERRVELKQALSQVEIAVSSPASNPNWRDHLVHRLDQLRVALDQHIEEVEGDEGLLAGLVVDAPRLANQIEKLQHEHPMLSELLDETVAHLKEGVGTDEIRDEVLRLLFDLVRHRQRGADLVYEAYGVDIGGS